MSTFIPYVVLAVVVLGFLEYAMRYLIKVKVTVKRIL